MKKNFSINEDKIKVNFMISKEINQKIKEKRFKEKTYPHEVSFIYR